MRCSKRRCVCATRRSGSCDQRRRRLFHAVAQGLPRLVEFLRNSPPTRSGLASRNDSRAENDRSHPRRHGGRSYRPAIRHGGRWSILAGAVRLAVSLRKDDALLGAISCTARKSAVHRQADRAVAELRGAGGHRDGERAAHHRDARGLEQQTATAEVLRSSIPRPAISRRCSMRCSKRRCGCAKPPSGILQSTTASTFAQWRSRGVPQIRRLVYAADPFAPAQAQHRTASGAASASCISPTYRRRRLPTR